MSLNVPVILQALSKEKIPSNGAVIGKTGNKYNKNGLSLFQFDLSAKALHSKDSLLYFPISRISQKLVE